MIAETSCPESTTELTGTEIDVIFLGLDTLFNEDKSKRTRNTPILLTLGIDATLSTVLADATLIWRCWIVWGRALHVVLVPIACTTFAIATLLWCTILIVYRILRVGGLTAGMRVHHRLVEMLVESASFYSAVIIILLVFEVRNEVAGVYIEEFAIATRGMVPTILVGRIAAGHARPDDSWSENSSTSSLRFRNHSSSETDSFEMSAGYESDISPRLRLDLENGLDSLEEKITGKGRDQGVATDGICVPVHLSMQSGWPIDAVIVDCIVDSLEGNRSARPKASSQNLKNIFNRGCVMDIARKTHQITRRKTASKVWRGNTAAINYINGVERDGRQEELGRP
ncbi:hypothetical protein ARMSODRAFT_980711 [Armillaria solidipes]|uniref:Uncharacterized protein n=1 Tax=Armillaria solidipes TaxID=1076256 RepID=A0A2H3AUK2_9AGAR|nr:hypothetical protein ARMSODRAFT_980711 [Armillaria solidipes]